jgi:two-component system phosphate regulon sensor histidine kinase PhoR
VALDLADTAKPMIKDTRREHIRSLLLLAGAAFGIGWLLGYRWIGLSLFLLGYMVWTLWQQNRLFNWLKDPRSDNLPEANGLWGSIFDYLYGLKRQHRYEIKRMNNILSKVQTSTAALEDGVVMVNQQGILEWWNDAAGKLLEFRDQDQGQLITNLIRDPRFHKFFAKGKSRAGITLTSPKRAHIQLHFSMTVYGENERLLLVRDVSRLKQLEQMRQDFVANASHELRTPLTVLQGYLEAFLDHQEELPSNMLRPLQQMQTQTKRMSNLVSDLLLLTRLDSDEQSRSESRIGVESLINGILEDARQLSGEKNHHFSVSLEPGLDVIGEAKELRSALSNLIYNAVHYTPADGEIELKWWSDEKGAYFSVKDNGIGIEPRHIPRLTERFYRVDISRSTATGGTGLGLAIVKHVLQHHDATLDISSRSGEGSTFTCRFPLSRVYQETSDASQAS